MPRKWLLVSTMVSVLWTAGGLSAAAAGSLMMATTTSTDNTGLLNVLAPKFRHDTGIELKWTAVGTGKALELGKNCDVDVLLVHAPAAEKEYVADGYGTDRSRVMCNDFVLIGPPHDPAGLKGMSVEAAIRKLAAQKALFVSRGDNSGTHKKEIALWKKAGVEVPEKEKWYIQTGQGMIATLNVATEKGAYTLTDRATQIKFADNHGGVPPLAILVKGDSILFNQYSVLAVDPGHCPNVRYEPARKFIRWITSDEVQEFIGNFQLLGQTLYIPNADR